MTARRPLLTVTLGASGAGKSTWIAANPPPPGTAHIHQEKVRDDLVRDGVLDSGEWGTAGRKEVHAEVLRRIGENLGAGRDVLFEFGNVRAKGRREVMEVGERHGAQLRLLVFDRPLTDVVPQVLRRSPNLTPAIVWRVWQEFRAALGQITDEPWDEVLVVAL